MLSRPSKANERFDFTFTLTADNFKPRILLVAKFCQDTEFHSFEKAGVKNKSKKTTKTKYLSLSATNMVFASLFLIIIVFKNQLLLEENYWWWFILETTLEVSETFFYTYITTSIVTMSFSCIISQIHSNLGTSSIIMSIWP